MTNVEISTSGRSRDRDLLLRAIDSVVPDRAGAFLIGPVSTGRRLMTAMSQESVGSFGQLLMKIGRNEYLHRIRWPNLAESAQFAERIRGTPERYLITLAAISLDTWEADDYLQLAFSLLKSKTHKAFLQPEWAYSSGCVQEFFFCLANDIKMVDCDDCVITANAARESLTEVRRMANILGLDGVRDEFDMHLARLRRARYDHGVSDV